MRSLIYRFGLAALGVLLGFSTTIYAQSGCNFETGQDVTFTVMGQNNDPDFVQHFVLTDLAGLILYSSAILPIAGVPLGQYLGYTINYDMTQAPPTLTVGTSIFAIGGDCVEVSTPLPIGVCNCNSTGDLVFSNSGENSNAGFTQILVLTDSAGLILSAPVSSPVSSAANGIYNVFAVNYDNNGVAPNLTPGTSIDNIGGDCVDISEPLGYVVCQVCSFSGADPNTACGNNGTPETSDDFWNVYLNPQGINLGMTYSVSGDITQNNVPYGSNQQIGGNIGFNIALVNLTITDDLNGCVLTDIVVPQPPPCPFDCPPNCLPVEVTKQ